jgi:N6-L-threonylcarbamoyladenine synthase
MQNNLNILAIETSCDETAAAVSCQGKIISNIIATQAIHEIYGGIVPELASRAHQKMIIPVVAKALQEAQITKAKLTAIAVTQGPGLLSALLVGISFAKSMAFSLGIPLITVQHMRAHVLANFIDKPYPTFPFLGLTMSGGHTQLLLVKDYFDMSILGQTQDDAIGEAFDKIAKLMDFPYPGGPCIDQYAQYGHPKRFQFPATNVPQLDFSFSGIKTAFRYFLQEQKQKDPNFVPNNLADLCASIQHTLIQMVLDKLKKAIAHTGIKRIAIAGGVASNQGLRNELKLLAEQQNCEVFIPAVKYCTDNAAMIAITAHHQYLRQEYANLHATALPRMSLS